MSHPHKNLTRTPTEIKTAHKRSQGLNGPTWHSTSLPSQMPFSQRPPCRSLPPSLTPPSAVPHDTWLLYLLIGFVTMCLQFHWIRGGTTDHWHQRGSNVGWGGSWSQLASHWLSGLRFSYVKCGEEYICSFLYIQWLLHNKPSKSIHHLELVNENLPCPHKNTHTHQLYQMKALLQLPWLWISLRAVSKGRTRTCQTDLNFFPLCFASLSSAILQSLEQI